MRVRRFAVAAVSLSTVAALAACSSSTTPAPTASGSSTASASSSGTGATGSGAYDPAHAGGTLTLLAKSAGGTLDPKINYTLQYWQLYQATYDGLTAFTKVDGDKSFTVTADLATEIPKPTNGGKTYVFTLRPGLKFSDGTDVTTDDVVASFQRIFKVSSPTAGSFYNGIVGADACLKTPASCTLAGGVVGDKAAGTVTINLKDPDPEFLFKLSVPHAAILPKSAPVKDAGNTPIPTTGPYMFASYDPNTALIMKRNPYFKEWSHDAQPAGYPDEIDYKFGLTVEAEVTAVENGQANWVFDPPPADRLAEIGSKYATQAHINPLTAFWYAPMNVNIPPFNNIKARQAVNWAVDRNAVVKLYGGASLGQPVCTFLPPAFPGHVDDCQYTNPAGTTWTGPDLEKAKLVTDSGTAGQAVTIVVSDDEVNKAIGEYLQSVLNSIGYKASVKPISGNIQFTYIQNTNNKVQISLTQWYQDYPAASDFLNVLLGCASFTPGSDSSINIAGYCSKPVQAMMDAALKTEQTSGLDAANAQWAAVDKAVMTDSPVAPLITPKLIDFVSKDVGNYQFSKQFYMLVSQLWVK